MHFIKRLFTHIIFPFLIAGLIFYFTKPSEEKCRKEATRKLATVNIDPEGIIVTDRIFMKKISVDTGNDTLSFGFGALFTVRISKVKMDNAIEYYSKINPDKSRP